MVSITNNNTFLCLHPSSPLSLSKKNRYYCLLKREGENQKNPAPARRINPNLVGFAPAAAFRIGGLGVSRLPAACRTCGARSLGWVGNLRVSRLRTARPYRQRFPASQPPGVSCAAPPAGVGSGRVPTRIRSYREGRSGLNARFVRLELVAHAPAVRLRYY